MFTTFRLVGNGYRKCLIRYADKTVGGIAMGKPKWENIKYTKRFEAIEQLEKSLTNLKDGYVFFRLGEKETDIEFRNTAKIEELK